jgi:sugar transferase (PEP-CTERM/EpsH1 system associated)
MRILNITNELPYPLVSGAPLRTYNILSRFAKNHDIYLAAFSGKYQQQAEIAQLLKFCREVVTVRKKPLGKLDLLWKLVKWPLEGGSAELRLSFSIELARDIQNLITKVDFDVILIEHGSMGLYLEVLPENMRKKAIWILHDIDFDKFRRISHIESNLSAKARAFLHSMIMKTWQPKYAQRFGFCVTMSAADRYLLKMANLRLRIEISPNGVDTHCFQPMPESTEAPVMLFIGNMGYSPNVDAVIYFYREIWPLIRKKIPDAEFWIVGINPRESIKKLHGNGVFVTGSVPDVTPYYRRAKVCIVPLRAGSGSRLKILEAMALGRPVISTTIGAEGLDVTSGKHLIIANNSWEFAEKTIELLERQDLRQRLITDARNHVVVTYDWDVISKKLLSTIEEWAVKTNET